MIPTIGVMIAAYIFTRMLEICMTKTSPSFLQLIAVVTMLIAVVAVHSDGMTRRIRQRMERRRRHRLANRRRRRLRKAETAKKKPAKPAGPKASAGAATGGRTQSPERERTPSDSARKRDDG